MGKISADDILKYFLQIIGLTIHASWETVSMKCKSLFSGQITAEFAQRKVNVDPSPAEGNS